MIKYANIPTFVKLVSKDYLDDSAAKAWYNMLSHVLPSGILTSVDYFKDGGEKSKSLLIRRNNGDNTELIVPLTRDLLPEELEKVKSEWRDIAPSGKYSVAINPSQSDKLQAVTQGLTLSAEEKETLSAQLAKVQHESWMRGRTKEGWRFGQVLSVKEKTHPMMRPWDELPEKYKKVDGKDPDDFLNFINDQGYTVIRQEELDSLMKILRKIR